MPIILCFFFFFIICDPGAQNQSHRYICSNSQKYIAWVKIIDFSLMTKIIRISGSKKIFCKCPTVNIWKRNFWLIICIAKTFLNIFLWNKPYINGQLIYSAFIWCINLNNNKKLQFWLVLWSRVRHTHTHTHIVFVILVQVKLNYL